MNGQSEYSSYKARFWKEVSVGKYELSYEERETERFGLSDRHEIEAAFSVPARALLFREHVTRKREITRHTVYRR